MNFGMLCFYFYSVENIFQFPLWFSFDSCCFTIDCFIFKYWDISKISFCYWFLTSDSDYILCTIPITWNACRLLSWPNKWSVFNNVPCVLKNVYSTVIGCSLFKCQWYQLVDSCSSLLIFLLFFSVLYIPVRGVLKSPTLWICLSIFSFLNFFFICLGAFLLGKYTFKIVLPCLLHAFIIMKILSSFRMLVFILKCSCNINIVTPVFLCLVLAQYTCYLLLLSHILYVLYILEVYFLEATLIMPYAFILSDNLCLLIWFFTSFMKVLTC